MMVDMTELLYVLPALFLIGGFFGDLVGGVGDVLGGIGDIPVVGDVIQAGAPIAGGILGGPLGGALGGVLGKAVGGGGSPQDYMQNAALGGMAGMAGDMIGQANDDRARSRELTEQGIGTSQEMLDFTRANHERLTPVRNQFLQAAGGFTDSTNPFSRPAMDFSMAMEPMGGGAPPTSPQGQGGGLDMWGQLQAEGHPVTQGGGGPVSAAAFSSNPAGQSAPAQPNPAQSMGPISQVAQQNMGAHQLMPTSNSRTDPRTSPMAGIRPRLR